jgi:hypothetical protein
MKLSPEQLIAILKDGVISDITLEAAQKFLIVIRDRFECVYCHRSIFHGIDKIELDHFVPRSAGGSHNTSNLVAACHRCNQRKGYKVADAPTRNSVIAQVRYNNGRLKQLMGIEVEFIPETSYDEKLRPEQAPNCGLCGSKMVIRSNRKQDKFFWGCTRNPSCHGRIRLPHEVEQEYARIVAQA